MTASGATPAARTCRARRGRSRWTTSRNCSGTRGGAPSCEISASSAAVLHNALTDTLPSFLHCPGERRFRAEFDRLAALSLPGVVPCGDGAAAAGDPG